MHQPWYGDPRSGEMVLPWTRLHALKDYLDMIAVAAEFPGCHLTFNLVPSLLDQVQRYAAGTTTDAARRITAIPADDLSADDCRWLLENGFKCHWPQMIEPVPRYAELLELRGRHLLPAVVDETIQRFTTQDWRDLQVWFQLAWCGHHLRSRDPLVASLVAQGRGYSEADQQALHATLDAAVGEVIPRYVAAAQAGHVELSTTPYYHPILPLLCHYPDVQTAMPGVAMPPGVVDLPDDAARQLQRGRQLCEQLLGFAPAGLWPSEGSVSTRALQLAAAAGFRWAATDEQILSHSLLRQGDPSGRPGRRPEAVDFLQPWQFEGLNLFFRHHRASDKIGFDYASWRPEDAVADLIRLLERTAGQAGALERPVVAVILDGENCWEYYPRNGYDFLRRLYQELEAHPWLEPLTFSEHLARAPQPPALEWVFPGSWINHDFYIWAGHREDQRAWELLHLTRAALVEAADGLPPEVLEQAWEHLSIAEGSDWFCWYGDDHSSADDAAFDALFRDHLTRVWELLGRAAPGALAEPIAGLAASTPLTPPVGPLTPQVDGRETWFYEWRAAGRLEGRGPAGAMSRQAEGASIEAVRYGFDSTHLYLAIDLARGLPSGTWSLLLQLTAGPTELELRLPSPTQRALPRHVALSRGGTALVAVDRFVELAIPLAAVPAVAGHFELSVALGQAAELADRWPGRGTYRVALPAADDDLRNWLV
ncbi:MAG: hypothetical protein IT204_24745 [Fimbriimonadaceae bacterium]|nr:hypothetical protein [Fimbriimonadaceae bacterium]